MSHRLRLTQGINVQSQTPDLPKEKILTTVLRFSEWLNRYGELSYDFQSFYAGPVGQSAKALYYRKKWLGTLAVSPMVFCEAFIPSARRLFWKPQRFPIADAHYAMGFMFLSQVLEQEEYKKKAIHFLEILEKTRCPGYDHYCWGYPCNWVTLRGTIKEGTPLITVAARAGALDVLRYLISAGADVNARTPAGETPVMLAAFFEDEGSRSTARHDSALRLLVSAGATVENEPHTYTPLAYAAYKGRDETLRYLLERGASVNANVYDGVSYVNTPLMMATIMGHYDTAMMLLNAGADARVRIKDGPTARELAVKYQHERLARVLVCAERLAPGERFSGKCQ